MELEGTREVEVRQNVTELWTPQRIGRVPFGR